MDSEAGKKTHSDATHFARSTAQAPMIAILLSDGISIETLMLAGMVASRV
jgi:hypothetical protein